MAADLLACPFCGGAAEIMEDGTGCVVACTDCDTGTYNRHATRARAVAVWNRRAPIAAAPVVTGEGSRDLIQRNIGLSYVIDVLVSALREHHNLPGYDWNADPKALTRIYGDALRLVEEARAYRATPPAAPVVTDAIVAAARAFDESYRLGWHATGRDYHDDADRLAAAIAAAQQGGTDANMLEAIDRTLDASLVDRALADRVRDAAHGAEGEG